MKKISFKDTYTLGNIVNENTHFKHIFYPEMLIRYDSNFIEFKILPSLDEFKETERYLKEFHLRKGQKHVKFYFPENIKPTSDLLTYLTDMSYEIGFLELYAIEPKQFPPIGKNSDIEIKVVTGKTLDFLLNLHYKNSLLFGIEFAKQKNELIKRQFIDSSVQQVLAFYKGQPVGHMDIIISDKIVEIDDLSVNELVQKKGIGSQLQKFVMDSFPDKTVLLIADGEDTPREMYQKQHYINSGFKYEIQKVDKD
ncbi:MAG: GNAT family N-acetyltransferase [Carnobacterium sp.]|uniref:GNAT family N-acetyltransferase n=1 Tax=Carnobacterium sp. TaxID=48221 RepID=UPI003C7200C2